MSLVKRDDNAVVWGRHEVVEALESGHSIKRIYFAREARGEQIERLKQLARERGVRFDFVEVGKLGKMAGSRAHQDVVARLSPVRLANLDELIEKLSRLTQNCVIQDDQRGCAERDGERLRVMVAVNVSNFVGEHSS